MIAKKQYKVCVFCGSASGKFTSGESASGQAASGQAASGESTYNKHGSSSGKNIHRQSTFGNSALNDSSINNAYIEDAKLLGEFIAKNHNQIIYGGGNSGLMGEVMRSFLVHFTTGNGANNIYSVTTEQFLTDYEKECLAVKSAHITPLSHLSPITDSAHKMHSVHSNTHSVSGASDNDENEAIVATNVNNANSTNSMNNTNNTNQDCVNVVLVGDFVERIEYFLGESDIFVVLGGGIGTLAELSAALCANKCEKLDKPVVIVNTNGYWNNFIATLNNMINNEFENKLFSDDNLLYVVESVGELKEKWHKITNKS